MTAPVQELAEHHEAAWGWALACCRFDRSEAQEVLQQAYLRVLDGRARFGGRSSLRTWWFGVIRRIAIERRRLAGARRLLLGRFPGAPEASPAAPDPEAEAARSEASRNLIATLQQISPRQREVLHLVFYTGLSIEEASETIGIGLGSARVHYARGKRRLRVLLEESGHEHARRAS